jgi:hypothetical protein
MEPIFSFTGITSSIHQTWILLVFGLIFLFFGTPLYYSAIRAFGAITGAMVGLLVCFNTLQGSSLSDFSILFIYIAAIVVGGLLGSTMALVFHHMVFFIFGAIIGIILYKMFALQLITPSSFGKITLVDFILLIKPTTNIEWIVMILGGVVYMASSHILIVITMSVVGAFLVASALHVYILFPILSAFGAVIQYMMTHRRTITLVRKHKN